MYLPVEFVKTWIDKRVLRGKRVSVGGSLARRRVVPAPGSLHLESLLLNPLQHVPRVEAGQNVELLLQGVVPRAQGRPPRRRGDAAGSVRRGRGAHGVVGRSGDGRGRARGTADRAAGGRAGRRARRGGGRGVGEDGERVVRGRGVVVVARVLAVQVFFLVRCRVERSVRARVVGRRALRVLRRGVDKSRNIGPWIWGWLIYLACSFFDEFKS